MKTVAQSNSPMLQAGKLRNRISIVQNENAQDTAGGTTVNNWTPVATVWASIEALSGVEKFAAHEFVSQASHSVVIRYNPELTITSAMQIVFGSRQFQIETVLNPDERTKMLQILCIEINDSQQQTA
jgi:SPP1 family predicted phage head-tail adaptor